MIDKTFDEVFVEEYPKLVALGTWITGDREVARELAQETMIRAHVRWSDLERYDAPLAWLRRVMTNLSIDHARSRASERSALQRLTPTAGPADDPPEPSSRWAELISPLTTRQRAVATLYYGDDLSVAEIAHILEVSTGSVKSTLFKVRRRLRRQHDRGGRP